MKTKILKNSVVIGLVGSLSLGVFDASADLEVSASVQISATAEFHAPLATHGSWIEVGSYGRCWRPASVAVGWRPYSHGHWVWTDLGWYWESDEPWSWACYHYGSWVVDSHHGWVWVPGIEWAPAWVSWRIGGGYCGWAPLGPRGVVVSGPSFVFVDVRRFHEPVRPTTVIVNNTTIINKTTQIAQVKQETRNVGGGGPKKVMVNEGPGLATIEKASGKKARQVSIQEAAKQTPVPTEVARKSRESQGKDKAPGEQEKPNPGQERKQAPKDDTLAPPAKPGGPDKGEKPRKDDEVKPAPRQPPTPDTPPTRPLPPDKGPDKGEKPPKDGIKPAPERPPAPSQPPTKPSKPAPKGKEKGKGGKDKEGGKDKP
ncbi:MAG TPA: DUF6600 domain-containing protein [Verrucomicrobiae bacterium]|nr:DUF6600 domain-containing protein [Verrucomicrobiae bacterium]